MLQISFYSLQCTMHPLVMSTDTSVKKSNKLVTTISGNEHIVYGLADLYITMHTNTLTWLQGFEQHSYFLSHIHFIRIPTYRPVGIIRQAQTQKHYSNLKRHVSSRMHHYLLLNTVPDSLDGPEQLLPSDFMHFCLFCSYQHFLYGKSSKKKKKKISTATKKQKQNKTKQNKNKTHTLSHATTIIKPLMVTIQPFLRYVDTKDSCKCTDLLCICRSVHTISMYVP